MTIVKEGGATYLGVTGVFEMRVKITKRREKISSTKNKLKKQMQKIAAGKYEQNIV